MENLNENLVNKLFEEVAYEDPIDFFAFILSYMIPFI